MDPYEKILLIQILRGMTDLMDGIDDELREKGITSASIYHDLVSVRELITQFERYGEEETF